MTAIRRNWPLFLLFASWLSLVPALWYVPNAEVVDQWSAAWASAGKEGEPATAFMNDAERASFEQGLQTLTDKKLVRRQLWKGWILDAFAVLLGLLSVVFAIMRTRGWKLALIVASLSYLVLIAHFPLVTALDLDRWLGWWLALTTYPGWGTWMVYHDVALPMVHTLLIIVLGFSLARKLLLPSVRS
jgi:hypothetical protein